MAVHSNGWKKWSLRVVGLIILSVLINHLSDRDHFPTSDDYAFPWLETLISLVLTGVIALIVRTNFSYHAHKFFDVDFSLKSLVSFFVTTCIYITVAYLPIYLMVLLIAGAEFSLFDLLVGWLVTLLLTLTGILFWYSIDIYDYIRKEKDQERLPVTWNRKTSFINYSEIAYAHISNKIIYLIKVDGTILPAEFTIQVLSSKLSQPQFFQANRGTIISIGAVSDYKKIENGKVQLKLVPPFKDGLSPTIVISRYKREELENWINSSTIQV